MNDFFNTITNDVFQQLITLHLKSLKKWGLQTHVSPDRFINITLEELGEASKELNEINIKIDKGDHNVNYGNYRNELLDTAAAAINAVVHLDLQLKIKNKGDN